ncbi:MAG: ribonuclease BN, partial [Nitrospiraceae bacterium]
MRSSFRTSLPTCNRWKLGGLSIAEFARRLWKESQKDELLGRAAQLAFYFLLALFPALIFLTALIGLFPLQDIMPELMRYLRDVLPAEALTLVERYLQQVVEGSSRNILSLGLLGALWASSSGVTAIMDALNAVYSAREARPFW